MNLAQHTMVGVYVLGNESQRLESLTIVLVEDAKGTGRGTFRRKLKCEASPAGSLNNILLTRPPEFSNVL